MPMSTRRYQEEGFITWPILEFFLKGQITAEAAVAELQNKTSLKLNE